MTTKELAPRIKVMIFELPIHVISTAIIVLGVWLLSLTILLLQNVLHYRRLTEKVDKKDLKSILEKILKDSKIQSRQIEEILKRTSSLEREKRRHLQKIGFIRFNPFSETGGSQSFVLSLLDEQDNGLVLSSLHSREATRFYAKKVKKGKGEDYQLSKEEQEAVKKARKLER